MENTTPAPQAASVKNKTSALKTLAWVVGSVIALVVILTLCAIILVPVVGPGLAAQAIATRTGFPVRYDDFSINLLGGKIQVANFQIENSASFGGGTFLELPTIVFEADLGSLTTQRPHLKDVNIHLSQLVIVKDSAGVMNAQFFAEKLGGSKKKEPAPASSSKEKKPEIEPTIDHLLLQIDTLQIVDQTVKPAKTTTLNLGFKFERQNIDDMAKLKAELTQAALATGLKNIGPAALGALAGSALGGASEALDIAGKGLDTGTAEAAKAAKKAAEAANALKNIFKK